jgi:hypothetical protein
LRFKVTLLVLFPGRPCIFNEGGLIGESVDITDFRKDAGREHWPDSLDGCQGIGYQFHLFGNRLIKDFDLLLHCSYRAYI